MAKSKPFSLSAMVDSDGEGNASDDGAAATTLSNKENAVTGAGAKRKGGRPKANAKRFTKPKRLSNDSVARADEDTKKSKAGRKKAPFAEVNQNRMTNADDADEFAQSDSASFVESKRLNAGTKRKAADEPEGKVVKTRDTKRAGNRKSDGEFQYTPMQGKKKSRKDAAQEIPETQASSDPPTMHADTENEATPNPSKVKSLGHGRALSHQRQPAPVRRRAGSASDADQGTSDPALRRKLGDMTRKYDSLNLKYRDLRDIGIKEAETNYESLRKQVEVNKKAAGDLIASLKKEIATQKAIAQETHNLRSELQSRDTDISKSRSVADGLAKSLHESQNENKVLQAKLSSSRGASIPAERTPGSAMRSKTQVQSKSALTSSGDLAIAQLKDDLYSDLTGLILRGVDVGPEADTFDCIQTGRNGTLHFKLAVTKDPEESYEDVEFQYTPRLDSSRDHDLIELLPEYLTEEITFSRMNAAPFYARIMDTLMKKRVMESAE